MWPGLKAMISKYRVREPKKFRLDDDEQLYMLYLSSPTMLPT